MFTTCRLDLQTTTLVRTLEHYTSRFPDYRFPSCGAYFDLVHTLQLCDTPKPPINVGSWWGGTAILLMVLCTPIIAEHCPRHPHSFRSYAVHSLVPACRPRLSLLLPSASGNRCAYTLPTSFCLCRPRGACVPGTGSTSKGVLVAAAKALVRDPLALDLLIA